MEKEINVNEKKIIIKEISYLNSIEIADLKESTGLKAAISKQMELATELPIEEIEKLTIREGALIQKAINEINAADILDFQEPVEEKEN